MRQFSLWGSSTFNYSLHKRTLFSRLNRTLCFSEIWLKHFLTINHADFFYAFKIGLKCIE